MVCSLEEPATGVPELDSATCFFAEGCPSLEVDLALWLLLVLPVKPV